MLDFEYRRTFKTINKSINNTLERIPVIRTVKHILDRLRGNGSVIKIYFDFWNSLLFIFFLLFEIVDIFANCF